MSVHSYARKREIGNSLFPYTFCTHYRYVAANDTLLMKKRLWTSLWSKDDKQQSGKSLKCSYADYQGIFGLKYSIDGKAVVAACENNKLVVIDPLTYKTICCKEEVHKKRCNTVTFIDERLFATCSDDKTVSIWDLRNMKESVMHLIGHKSWVKNVEFHKPTQQLVSSGFDNQVIAWDLNKCSSEGGCPSKTVLECACLTRMRLSADGSSMYLLSDNPADLIAIHNLQLGTLAEDSKEEWLNHDHKKRRISYDGNSTEDADSFSSQPFSQCNRVEFYHAYRDQSSSDLSYAACSSLDVHPENCAVVMRYDWCSSVGAKYVSVHNTWSYYDGPYCGENNWKTDDKSRSRNPNYLPLQRGLPTNYVCDHELDNGEYIQEVAFSDCGNLIASPSGFGIRILAYDKHMTDYRTHIAQRVCEKHVWGDGDTVRPANVQLSAQTLHTVKFCFGHSNLVLCACFSPSHLQVASGSVQGQILLHEVVL